MRGLAWITHEEVCELSEMPWEWSLELDSPFVSSAAQRRTVISRRPGVYSLASGWPVTASG